MSTTQLLLSYCMLFIGVLLAATSALSLTRRRPGPARPYLNRRLMLQAESGASQAEVLNLLRRNSGGAEGLMRFIPFGAALTDTIQRSGLSTTPEQIARLILGLSALWTVLIWVLVPITWLKSLAVLGPVLGALPIVLVVQSATARRAKAFEAQLPNSLDLMVRSLRIGHPVSASIGLVAREMPDPVGTEFGIAFDEITYGSDLPTAFNDLANRVPVPDLRYVAVAVQIQAESGGNLAEVLSGLSSVIRDRFRMFRKVHAITAEGRFSAWFMSIFPFFIALFIQLIKPTYYIQVADSPLFVPLTIATVVLLLANIAAMRVLTKINV